MHEKSSFKVPSRGCRFNSRLAHQFLLVYPLPMPDETPAYLISIKEEGRWRHLLYTLDKDEADAMYASLMADEGVRVKFQVILPRKK